MKKFLSLLVCLASAGTAQALPYSVNNNIVTVDGLGWLQWNLTADWTVSDMLNELSDGNLTIGGVDYGTGWSIASTFQMVDLFNIFGFGITPDSWNGTTDQSTSNNDGTVEDLSTDPELQFLQLFGTTSSVDDTQYEYTAAIFGTSPSDANNPKYNLASVLDDYLNVKTTGRGTTETVEDGTVILDVNSIQGNKSDLLYGIALVNASLAVAATPAPEPETVGIMTLGLGLLGASRFRRKK